MSRVIVSKLNGVRRKHAAVAAGRAAAAVVGLVVACLAGGMLLDRWLDLAAGWRAALLAADAAAAVAVLLIVGVRPVVGGPTVEQAALWVERVEPTFRSRLISAVQFHRGGDLNGSSPALVAVMVEQAERLARDVPFGRVVSTTRLRRTLVLTATVVAVAGGGAAYGRAVAVPLLERALLVPGVELPKRTRITADSGDVAIARGEPITLTARVAGEVPPAGRVRVTYAGGGRGDFTLPAAGPGLFAVKIGNVQDGFAYTIDLGDDTTPPRHVRVSVRPAVVSVACSASFPAYAKLPPAERSPYDLHVLAGGRLAIRVKANKPLRASPNVAGNHVRLIGSDVDFALAGDVNDPSNLHAIDGRSADVPVPAGTTAFRVELVDDDGLRSVDPVVYRVTIDADGPPTVRLTAPAAGDVPTVTPAAKPAIAVEAEDDFGVARLSLRYRITHAGKDAAVQDDPRGLAATYYSMPDLTGTGIPRVDPAVNLDWAVDRPPAGIAGSFGVRWVGTITAPSSGDYAFRGEFSGGVRLWVDGRQLLDRWAYANNTVESRPTHLVAGRPYPIRIDAQGTTLSATGTARLLWRTNATNWVAIPHDALRRPMVATPTTGPTSDVFPLDPAGLPARSVRRRLAWDLAALPTPPVPGDTVEVWAEAADANDVTGPGVATSEHRTFRVVTADQKRKELLDRLGDYMGKVRDVSDDERTLNDRVGKMVPAQ